MDLGTVLSAPVRSVYLLLFSYDGETNKERHKVRHKNAAVIKKRNSKAVKVNVAVFSDWLPCLVLRRCVLHLRATVLRRVLRKYVFHDD